MGKKLNLTNGVSFGGKYTVVAGDQAVSAVSDVITLTVTAGCAVNGNVGVVLRGATAVEIAVTTTADTPAEVATLIAAGLYTDYTAAASTADVVFTAKAAGAKTGTNSLAVGLTGVVGTFDNTTPGVTAVAGSVTFDCSSVNTTTLVNYDMVAAFNILSSANVYLPPADVIVTYPANGQIKITDGTTFKLTAGQIINIVSQRSVAVA